MTNRAPDASKGMLPSRKIVWLGVAVLIAVGAWTGLWFYGAGRIEAYLPTAFAAAGKNGAEPRCDNADIRGYPFRVGLFCDASGLTLAAEGISAQAGSFRSAAQIYNPRHLVSELDGPLVVTGKEGLAARVDWQLLRASTVLADDGLMRGSVEGRTLTLDLDGPGLVAKVSAAAERIAVHLRRNAADLDIAADGEGLSSPLGPGARVFAFSATVPGGAAMLTASGASQADLRGREIRLHDLSMSFPSGGSLAVTGALSVAADGLVSGDLKVTMRDQAGLIAALRQGAPELADQIEGVAQVIAALDIEPGDDAVTLPVTIRNGAMASGFFPLGTLPPL